MTKLINLDELEVQTHRKVRWKGNEYNVRDFTVRDFVDFQKHFKAFSNSYSSDDSEGILSSADKIIKMAIPEFSSEDIEQMNPVQLLSVVALIGNLYPNEAEAEAEASAQGEAEQGNVD
jgi:hypothetical protein